MCDTVAIVEGDHSGEMDALRAEITRLLAAALKSDSNHATEITRLKDVQAAEIKRLEDAQATEIVRIEGVQAAEIKHLEEAQAAELLQIAKVQVAEILHLEGVQAAEIERVEGVRAVEVANLNLALASRDLIGQAKGILMVTLGCAADEAFAWMVTQSQHENRKVTAIAADIVARTRRIRAGDDDA
jgi:AmiR/NasT family two-component response regulator